MTPRQVKDLYFCERDEHGRPRLDDGPALDPERLRKRHLYQIGMTDGDQ